MFDNNEDQYIGAVDTLDVKYIDGIAYMSIHTIDTINASISEIVDIALTEGEERGEEIISDEMLNGMLWVMSVYRDLHDELDLRAEVKQMPDHVPTDLLEE